MQFVSILSIITFLSIAVGQYANPINELERKLKVAQYCQNYRSSYASNCLKSQNHSTKNSNVSCEQYEVFRKANCTMDVILPLNQNLCAAIAEVCSTFAENKTALARSADHAPVAQKQTSQLSKQQKGGIVQWSRLKFSVETREKACKRYTAYYNANCTINPISEISQPYCELYHELCSTLQLDKTIITTGGKLTLSPKFWSITPTPVPRVDRLIYTIQTREQVCANYKRYYSVNCSDDGLDHPSSKSYCNLYRDLCWLLKEDKAVLAAGGKLTPKTFPLPLSTVAPPADEIPQVNKPKEEYRTFCIQYDKACPDYY